MQPVCNPFVILAAALTLSSCGAARPQKLAAPAVGASAGPMLATADGVATKSAPATVATGSDTMAIPEKLVVEAWATVEVEDVRAALQTIRGQVAAGGGRIVEERLDGSSEAWTGRVKLRLPPDKIDGFWETLASLGEIRSKQVKATDVSKILFDQQLRLDNLTLTLERLRKLLDDRALKMSEVLEIEKEMTRLRSEIEVIKGEKRFLEDRVAYSTIELTLERREGVVLRPEAKFYPGPRLSSLTLLGGLDGRERNRLGLGVSLQFPTGKNAPVRTGLELDVFADADGAGNGVLATSGAEIYSDFFGGGRRAFLNPYISFRVGYAYLDGSRFAIGGGAGVELFKHERFLVDLNVRAMALIGSETDTALVGGLGGVVAF